MRSVDLFGLGIDSSTGIPMLVLREHDEPHRLLPIMIGNAEAASIAQALSGQEPTRPLTHDLMATLVESLQGQIDAVEVTQITDGTFHADLAIHGPAGDLRLDTRPSDAIALAVRLSAPMFVAEQVLDQAGRTVELDESEIDHEVEEFRSFIDEIDASWFADEGESKDEGE